MKTYARIENDRVVEILAPVAGDDGKEIPIEERLHPAIVETLVDVTDLDVGLGYVYAEGAFTAPAGASLADVQAAGIKTIDADVDAIYAAVIGNRQAEYDVAEAEANAYKTAGYAGAVPASVQSWATAKNWTPKKAAGDILTTSAAWRAAQADIRANRLARKEDVRNAADAGAVDAVLVTWAAYVAQMRAALGA